MKNQNVIIWRFHDVQVYPALLQLQEEGIIDIKAWFGDHLRCPYCTHDIFPMLRYLELSHDYRPYDWDIYQKVYPALFKFINMSFPRKRFYYSRPMHDFVHLFNIYFNFFYHLLKDNQINAVLFGFIPHQGPEYVLYELAKVMNIKTVMVLQSTDFPNRFFYSYSIEDFSTWKDNDSINQQAVCIAKTYRKKLLKVKTRSFRWLERRDLEKLKRSFSKVKFKWHRFSLFNEIQWRVMRWKKNREYNALLRAVCENPDFSQKFVYFPLHHQPELTTEVLGGIFVDQVLAIERLHDLLPSDWYIYVKDYPRLQNNIMRPPKFFERLKALPKVKLVPSNVDTYDLMERCQFVATITGSAGWEAISGGKCALVFGQAWYKSLPGVFCYNEKLMLEEILSYTIDHTELNEKMAIIMSKMAEGIVDPHHIALYNNYTDDENFEHLTKFFRHVLARQL